MAKVSSCGSVCELETQILLAGDLKGVKGIDKVFREQTLESLTPGILGPSSPTKLEKNRICKRESVNFHVLVWQS